MVIDVRDQAFDMDAVLKAAKGHSRVSVRVTPAQQLEAYGWMQRQMREPAVAPTNVRWVGLTFDVD